MIIVQCPCRASVKREDVEEGCEAYVMWPQLQSLYECIAFSELGLSQLF